MEEVRPYKDGKGKKEQVARMFDKIAHRYDFLNHFFSLGIDNLWRNKLVKILQRSAPDKVLDIATGTGDLAFAVRKKCGSEVVGVDISEGMLEKGREKIQKKGIEGVELKFGDSEELPFEDGQFDAVVVAFGVRNFEDVEKGLKEIHRVLRSDGTALILEFSHPKALWIKPFFWFYFRLIMPVFGKWISGDPTAYSYLPESVKAFPDYERFTKLMENQGFKRTGYRPVTGGIATIYEGKA